MTSDIDYTAVFHLWSFIFLTYASFGSFFPDIGFFQIPSHSSSKQIIHDTANSKILQGHESAVFGMHSCYKCGKMYSWKANLLRHLRLECGKRPQLQCPHCPYITKRKSSLNRHVGSRHVAWCWIVLDWTQQLFRVQWFYFEPLVNMICIEIFYYQLMHIMLKKHRVIKTF